MDIIVLILVSLLAVFAVNSFSAVLKHRERKTLYWLWFYHLIFGVYYCFFISGDALRYWYTAVEIDFTNVVYNLSQSFGTAFTIALNYIPANLLGLSYFSGTLLYTLLGFTGLLLAYVSLLRMVPYNTKYAGFSLFPLLFFLPNLHFWSVAVGKDTLTFFSICLLFYSVLHRRYLYAFFALALAYFVRPHIAIMLVTSFGVVALFSQELSAFRRILLLGASVAVGIIILPVVLEYAKIDENAGVEAISNFSDRKASLLSREHTDSRIDISSYPLPLKLFTFLYRPLFFDINGVPAVIASFENLLLLLLSVKLLFSKPVAAFRAAPIVVKAGLVFLVIGTLLFAQSMGNLGIMLRMKNMFMPGFLLFFLWTFSYYQQVQRKHQLARRP